MEFARWTLSILLAIGLTQASWIPTRNRPQRAEPGLTVSSNDDTVVKIHRSDFATLEELAEELIIDYGCLLDANRLLSTFQTGDYYIIPYGCCGTNCKGKFCSKSPECQYHSPSSAPLQTSVTTTTCVASIGSSIPTTILEDSTLSLSTIITVVPPTTSSTSITFLASSSAAVNLPASSTAVHPPTTSSNVPPRSSSFLSHSSSITSGSLETISGSSTILGILTTSNSLGQTAILDSSEAVTPPTGIFTASVGPMPDSSIVTFPSTTQAPSSSSVLGIPLTRTDPIGETAFSSSGDEFTIPTAATTPSTLTPGNRSSLTLSPILSPSPDSSSPTLSLSTGTPETILTTDPIGETTFPSSGDEFIIPTAATTPSTLTNGEGSVFTFSPSGSPSSSSTSSLTTQIDQISPVTTFVNAPRATDGGTEIPCNLWFFNLCIQFGDISIGGWIFNLPRSVRPPGPPPEITFPPSLSISVSISGTLPRWPSVTIGPDNLPTFEPKPTDGPDDGCKTASAEICLSSTSFAVDTATLTTTSSVLSTCATIFGCDVRDSASLSATTSTASSSDYPYSCTPGCKACVAGRGLQTATAAPLLSTIDTNQAKHLVSHARNLTLAERDIPSRSAADGPGDFYDDFRKATGTTTVKEDTAGSLGAFGIPSSRFKHFDNSEFNILVQNLHGCTSVVVVSRLGVYVNHLWEAYFALNIDSDFQTGVINYLNTGRDSGLAGGVTEGGVTEPLRTLVQRGVFGNTATTKIFIMTPATYDLDLDPKKVSLADRVASLTNGDFQPLFDGSTTMPPDILIPDRLTPLKAQLGQLMPGVPISQFTYRRQLLDDRDDRPLQDAHGTAAVVYSNDQREDPDTEEPLGPPQQAIWQCWMQGKLMGSDRWSALPVQTGSCPANQKRQAGGLCSFPTTSRGTPTVEIITTLSTSVIGSVKPTTSKILQPPNMPCLRDIDCTTACEGGKQPRCFLSSCRCMAPRPTSVVQPTSTRKAMPKPTIECPEAGPTILNGKGDDDNCRCFFDETSPSYPRAQEREHIASFCDGSTLEWSSHHVGHFRTYALGGGKALKLFVVPSTIGVGCKFNTDVVLGEYCRTVLERISTCDALGSDTETKGGSYHDNGEFGCWRWYIGATDAAADENIGRDLDSPAGSAISGDLIGLLVPP